MTSTDSPVESGVSLTVDELEEKLSTLRNYLSTPYRARAKAILQKRRQREAQALLSRSQDVLLCSSNANDGRVASVHGSAPLNSPASMQNASSAKQNASSNEKPPDEWPMRVAVASSTIPTELKSKYNSEHEVAKRSGRSEVCEPSPAACAAAQTLTLDPHTRRYVQQLEWQVKMLADALQEERERLAEIDAHVVQPLLQLGDAALRRQLQLEAALALGRSRKHGFARTRENMPAISGPFRSVWALLSLLVCLSTLTAMVVVDASPAYLLAQRRGRRFTYEAKYDDVIDMDSLLPNASCSFLYAFTEEMNRFIKDLVNSPVMTSFGTGAEEHGFDNCNKLSSLQASWDTSYILSGCFKALLHTGIAGDCLAENPFCCIQYWRYPPSLPDRLPSNQIDPRLIFWDGTKAVNGFYTNFSDKYRALYQNCSSFRPWPECTCIYGANSTLAVDANGEWRYTRRYMPFLTYIEHRVDTPADTESAELARLVRTSTPTWAAVHQFGDIPLLVPIVVTAWFIVIFFIFIILMYLCGYKPVLKEEKELRAKIEDVQARTAEVEEKLAAKRRRNKRTTTPLARASHGSFASLSTGAPSHMSQRCSSSNSICLKTTQPHMLSAEPQQHWNVGAAAPLTQQGCLSDAQSNGSCASSRKRTDSAHRRPLVRTDSICSRKSNPTTTLASADNDPPAKSIGTRASSTNSIKSAASGRSPESFQNPLIGRQTFGV